MWPPRPLWYIFLCHGCQHASNSQHSIPAYLHKMWCPQSSHQAGESPCSPQIHHEPLIYVLELTIESSTTRRSCFSLWVSLMQIDMCLSPEGGVPRKGLFLSFPGWCHPALRLPLLAAEELSFWGGNNTCMSLRFMVFPLCLSLLSRSPIKASREETCSVKSWSSLYPGKTDNVCPRGVLSNIWHSVQNTIQLLAVWLHSFALLVWCPFS